MTTATSNLGWGITRKGNKEMREILFRGKRIDNGKWVEGELLHDMKGRPWIYWTTPKELPIFFLRSAIVKSETVGEYTGLTDKNGKKIFEGDIVRDCDGKIYEIKHFDFEWIAEMRACWINIKHLKPCEIIGNVLDYNLVDFR